MAARILDGKALAQEVLAALAPRVTRLREAGIVPRLRVVRVGDDPASQVYVRGKLRACAQVGVDSAVLELPAGTSATVLYGQLAALNDDPTVHGILVQLPLPGGIDPHTVAARVASWKDVDGFHPTNLGKLVQGEEALLPCTPAGIMRLLDIADVDLRGMHAVVIGRSEIVGKPLALMLLKRDATVTICHSKTKDLASYTRGADVLVVAVGRAGLVDAAMVKTGAVVIDVGINRTDDGRLVGDVEARSVAACAGYLTPVPGGVGPMTIAMLVANTVRAAELQSMGAQRTLSAAPARMG